VLEEGIDVGPAEVPLGVSVDELRDVSMERLAEAIDLVEELLPVAEGAEVGEFLVGEGDHFDGGVGRGDLGEEDLAVRFERGVRGLKERRGPGAHGGELRSEDCPAEAVGLLRAEVADEEGGLAVLLGLDEGGARDAIGGAVQIGVGVGGLGLREELLFEEAELLLIDHPPFLADLLERRDEWREARVEAEANEGEEDGGCCRSS
jgi:hypothetical protein